MNENEYLSVQLSTWERDGQGTQRKTPSVSERFPSFGFPFSCFRNTLSFPVPPLRNEKNKKCLRFVSFSSLAPVIIKINYPMVEFVHRNLKCASCPWLFSWVRPVNGRIWVKLKISPHIFAFTLMLDLFYAHLRSLVTYIWRPVCLANKRPEKCGQKTWKLQQEINVWLKISHITPVSFK